MKKLIYIIILINLTQKTSAMDNQYKKVIKSVYEERNKMLKSTLDLAKLYPDIQLTEDDEILFYLYINGFIESINLPKEFRKKIENLGKNKNRKNMTRSVSITDVFDKD